MLMDSSLNAFASLLRQLVFGPTKTEKQRKMLLMDLNPDFTFY